MADSDNFAAARQLWLRQLCSGYLWLSTRWGKRMVLALWKYAVVPLAFILPHTSACVVIETLTNLYRVIAGLCPQFKYNTRSIGGCRKWWSGNSAGLRWRGSTFRALHAPSSALISVASPPHITLVCSELRVLYVQGYTYCTSIA